jgi:hypothetical protein
MNSVRLDLLEASYVSDSKLVADGLCEQCRITLIRPTRTDLTRSVVRVITAVLRSER